MEALATWQNRTLCKMTSTHQEKEIRVTISFICSLILHTIFRLLKVLK